jgi:hypothetical protein
MAQMIPQAKLGKFALRCGRTAYLFSWDETRGQYLGMLAPVSPQGEPELGHHWKPNGEYSVSATGVPHTLDLSEHLSDEVVTPKQFEDRVKGK